MLTDLGEGSGGAHLYCQTSRGKTTTLVVGGSVCGGGDPRTGFISSWKTTSNGMEPLLAGHNDGTVFLDEISQADPRAIGELIYTASNNTGKNRMTRDLKAAATLLWRDMILSTGETTLAAHARRAGITLPGGAAVRVIDIPADAGKGMGVFEDLHGYSSPGVFADKLKAAALECYGVALRQFLDYLTRLAVEGRRSVLQGFREEFLAVCNLNDAGPEVLRAANRMGVIAAAGELAILLEILPWPVGTAIDGVVACFRAWRESRGSDAVAHDDARAIEQVRLFLERYGSSRFEKALVSARVGMVDGANQRAVIDRAGWHRRDEYLVQTEFFRSELCRGFDAPSVARALNSAGFLRRQGRHWTIRTSIRGVGKREVYCIKKSIMAAPKMMA